VLGALGGGSTVTDNGRRRGGGGGHHAYVQGWKKRGWACDVKSTVGIRSYHTPS
jgi:hypothetical protein